MTKTELLRAIESFGDNEEIRIADDAGMELPIETIGESPWGDIIITVGLEFAELDE